MALAAASVFTSPIMKTSAYTAHGEKLIKEKICQSYDVRRKQQELRSLKKNMAQRTKTTEMEISA